MACQENPCFVGVSLCSYHRNLYLWHCRTFFDFRCHLTPKEQAYLDACFRLAVDFRETSEFGYSGFSYYSYSHRVRGKEVNSSRLAYGSIKHYRQALQAAWPVWQERGINFPPFYVQDERCRFYGLGWDIMEKQFKVYFRVHPISDLPDGMCDLIEGYALDEYRPEGLVSFTYIGDKLVERKVYLYPLDRCSLPEGVSRKALMITDLRGEVPQLDLKAPERWQYKLNPVGRKICRLYRRRGEPLDTIAYENSDNYTLYFP